MPSGKGIAIVKPRFEFFKKRRRNNAQAAERKEKHLGPHPGPQTDFFTSQADIVLYGGGAGGGKSFAILVEPLRHHRVPGFYGGIFRRKTTMITAAGGLWDEASDIYRSIGGRMRSGTNLDVRWRGGAKLEFNHLNNEATKYEYQGTQFNYLAFDELTHFTKTQWLYLLSRLRTKTGIPCYVRCTCNPDAGSWVAGLVSWWIDQATGLAIPERCGVIRYFVHHNDDFVWGDTRQELVDKLGVHRDDVLSFTFISASVHDNPSISRQYIAFLRSQPKIERERLLECNWKTMPGSIIQGSAYKRYHVIADRHGETAIQLNWQGETIAVPQSAFRRYATIDTAGTSKQKALEAKGDPPSFTCCAIWDLFQHQDKTKRFDILLLRYMWRRQVNWDELKEGIPRVLRLWKPRKTFIENAHYGQPLWSELRKPPPNELGVRPSPIPGVKLVGPKLPGMDDTSRGAKLERAIASGLLTRLEDIGIWLPDPDDESAEEWLGDYEREVYAWTGKPKETSDQIDVTSYAAWEAKKFQAGAWGGGDLMPPIAEEGNRSSVLGGFERFAGGGF